MFERAHHGANKRIGINIPGRALVTSSLRDKHMPTKEGIWRGDFTNELDGHCILVERWKLEQAACF
jgi:hypothetical protein